MAAPGGDRYGWIRGVIPEPNEPGLQELVEDLRFLPGGETVRQYCSYTYDLCVIASQSIYAYTALSHPLAICEVILAGLPTEEPWMAIKAAHSSIAVVNDWGRLVPNESKYRHPDNGTYSMNPAILRQRLWEIEQTWEAEMNDAEEDMDEDEVQAAEAAQQEVEADDEAEGNEDEEPEEDPEEDPEEEEPEEDEEIHEVIDVDATVDVIEIISSDDEEEYTPLTDDGEHDFMDISSDDED